MKLSDYEIAEACAANDYPAAAELIRRNCTGEIVNRNVAAFPVFTFSIASSNALVPLQVEIWIGPRCWYWDDLHGYGDYDLSDYDFDPVSPSERICIKRFTKQ
jgi:hypothetical protein